MESDYADYDISNNGFIEDIEATEMENTRRIENRELEDESIQWLEKQLLALAEEFCRKTGFSITF